MTLCRCCPPAQIRLWEGESNRLESYGAFMLDKFEHVELYRKTLSKAEELGILLWASAPKQALVVRADEEALASALLAFIKQTKQQMGL